MALASAAVRTTNVTVSTSTLEIFTSASGGYRLLELGITINAATATVFGFGKPAAIGVTPAGGGGMLFEDQGNSSSPTSNTALSWATAPTSPSPFQRRVSLPATIGAGIIWTFPRGYNCLKSNSLTVFNITASSAADIWVVIDE